jgi:membrane protease YdiL (CAAX protease family)
MTENKKPVANRIALLLLAVLALLMLLDIFTGYFLKNITNLHKILIYCAVFLLPIGIYIKSNKYKAGSMLKLSHFKVKHLPFVILFGLSVSVICALINVISSAILGSFLDVNIPTSTVNFSSENPFVVGLTAVFLPAFCEELLIRGVALSEYEKYGVPISVLVSSVVFSLFHGSLFTFLSLFAAGVCYAVLTHLFKSVWPAIICHCINNALSVYISSNSDYLSYLASDFLFITILVAVVFIVLIVMLKLAEGIVDDLGNKKRLKSDTRNMVYGEPLGSLYIWIFFAISIFNMVRNALQ